MEARQGSNGRTALHIAAARGSIEDMVLLLENGADVNISSAEGLTALDLAAIQGNLEMVTLLLDHNAKVDTLGIRKMTPLDQVIMAMITTRIARVSLNFSCNASPTYSCTNLRLTFSWKRSLPWEWLSVWGLRKWCGYCFAIQAAMPSKASSVCLSCAGLQFRAKRTWSRR